MKKLTFKEWYQSEGIEEVRYGTSDMVNISILDDAFHANDEYIKFLEDKFKNVYDMTPEEYLCTKDKL